MLSLLCLVACRKTPDGILNQEEMASLMADIHMGEAIIDYNYSLFPNDSTRKMLKQSIYLKHGVDQAVVDSSFVWYGNHIEDYIKVYDRTIEILQDKQRDFASATNAQITIAGDSVEIWFGPRHVIVNSKLPSNIVSFNIEPDSTWQNGDIYLLSYKAINSQVQINGKLSVDYTNGTSAYADVSTTNKNRNLFKLELDSTLTPTRLYGYLEFPVNSNATYEIDSLSLTRVRHYLMGRTYIPQKTFKNGIATPLQPIQADSLNAKVTHNGNRNAIHLTAPTTHRPTINRQNLPESSSERQKTEHRQTAGQHKVDRSTNAATRYRANNRQQTVTTRQNVKKTDE